MTVPQFMALMKMSQHNMKAMSSIQLATSPLTDIFKKKYSILIRDLICSGSLHSASPKIEVVEVLIFHSKLLSILLLYPLTYNTGEKNNEEE
jgi:hypothetical protein